MRSVDLIRIVESGYRLDVPDETWLRDVTRHIADLFPGECGTIGYLYDVTDPTRAPRIGPLRTAASTEKTEMLADPSVVQQMLDSLPLAVARATHPEGVLVSTFSRQLREMALASDDVATWARVAERGDFRDSRAVVAGNSDARGVVFSTQLTEEHSLDPAERRSWVQIGMHLAAAERLRRRLSGDVAPEEADAVLDAADAGKLLHITDDAQQRVIEACDELSRAARAIDRARTSFRHDEPMEALALWRGLVDGRWSLVEHVESDGRRLMLAHRNDPSVRDPRGLTRREKQVVDRVVLGHSNKLIGYDLGLGTSTVASHLSSALNKLGMGSRLELIALYQRLLLESE